MKKLNKMVLALCVAALITGTFVFLPADQFQVSRPASPIINVTQPRTAPNGQASRSVSPTGKGTLVAVTQPRTTQSGVDNSSTDLFIEDAAGARSFWFSCENGTFNPKDYNWSKDGSLVAAKFVWSVAIDRMDTVAGQDFLLSADLTNGQRQVVPVGFSPPSPTALQVIPQLLTKRGGAVAATWSAPKNLSLSQRLSYAKK